MKLGLKEIGVVVTLAAAGCTSPDTHSDTITEEMVTDIRQRCEERVRAIVSRLFEEGLGFEGLIDQAVIETRKDCLALHGLKPLGF